MPKKVVLKTKENDASVSGFIAQIADDQRRQDCEQLLKLFTEAVGAPAKMWGTSIVGFGSYTYKRSNGEEGDWFLAGFSPRKQNLTIYIMAGFTRYEDVLKELGKFTHSKGCLYMKKLDDVDVKVLGKLVKISSDDLKAGIPAEY